MSSSNCCFLTCIQISQEASQVVRYSHLFKNFPHSQRLWHSQQSRSRCFSGTLLLFQWSNRCWQFDIWFLRKRSVFIPIPKKGNAKECSNCHTTALISHARKIMLKILQARLQQYMNHELPDVQAGFRKGRGTRDQIANIDGSSKKQESSRKTYISALLTMPNPLTVDHHKLWKILREMGIPDNLTCLLRNLYAG